MCRYSEIHPEKIEDVYCKICGPEFTIAVSGNTPNMRSHLAHVHKDIFCDMISSAAGSGAGDSGGSGLCSGSGTNTDSQQTAITAAQLPPVPNERRDALHKLISLWIVRRKRPFSICEDQEFRDVFDHIFQGGYIPPCHKLVNQNVLSLSTEGRAKVCSALKDLFREGISPCIAGDIWSEGGVAIFGILVYWLTADGEYK
ncbi:hypothetical protein CYMTET_11547 [Cymbomonas tetramitiformis]|uniref:BED-type domain-containing protein n=1 Tax=Cymbomonas tetramitiformis TaxID=36881 RepID=A0AAE0GLV6_9CHLO|nr:hypothetical protein CYMTET_11547 [Cymbomonas tetramitiformis]